MYYYIKNTLEKAEKLDLRGKNGQFVAVLTSKSSGSTVRMIRGVVPCMMVSLLHMVSSLSSQRAEDHQQQNGHGDHCRNDEFFLQCPDHFGTSSV